jgi:PKD repeat protein
LTGISKNKEIAIFLVLTILCPVWGGIILAGTNAEGEIQGLSGITLKPSRVLVVIDIDWSSDPQSYVESSDWAFHDVICLLKLWSIPFDILRLDKNLLNITEFLDTEGKPKYGVIIWNCRQDRFGPGSTLGTRDWSVLQNAVANYGISLIALANTILEPNIQGLLGINYVDLSNSICWYAINDSFLITKDHFITRGYNGTTIDAVTMGGQGSHVGFDATKATVLGSQGQWPQLAVRDLNESTKAVWIGGNRDSVFSSSPIMAKILRNAITYCIGYSLYKTYPDTVLLRIDDMGSSQSAYLGSWLYAQLSQDQIRNSLIQPLLAHNATLAVYYVTGYPRNIEKTVLKSWTVDWIDPQGTRQNLTSDYLGILEGISKGVLEIASHGWTHMDPDLDSAPGPWWNNTGGTAWNNTAWYREFDDLVRGNQVDAATQNIHFSNSINYTLEAFNTFPLSFAPPADAISGAPSGAGFPNNYTYLLAALNGFGFASDTSSYCYLGPPGDIVISNMKMTRTYPLESVSSIRSRLKQGGGWDIPILAYFHDRDVALDPNHLNTYLTYLEAPATLTEDSVKNYISNDEFAGYLHASTNALQSALGFSFGYDAHYCKYFGNNTSTWTLHLSDDLLQKVTSQGELDIMIDGIYNATVTASGYFKEFQDLMIPSGIGTHTIQFVNTVHTDIAVVNVAFAPGVIVAGTPVKVNVTVENEGGTTNTFNVTAFYDNNMIGQQTYTDLIPTANATLVFLLDTTGLPSGNYTIRAEASQVPGDTNTTNNFLVGGLMRIVGSPTATFTYYPLSPKINDTVLFNATLSSPSEGLITSFNWNFNDGNTASTIQPTLAHVYALAGTYNVTLATTDTDGLNASTWRDVNVISQRYSSISLSTFSNSRYVGFKTDINGTLMDDEQIGIPNAVVVISYTFQGISNWLPLTSATTDVQGNYNIVWIPPTTGYFTVRAEWPGNDTYVAAEKNTTLNVISYEDNYVFAVTSNSTVTALTFNSTSHELSFTVSGPSGTSGFSQTTIAKTLVANASEIKVYLDGNQIDYSLDSIDDSWVIYINYTHSTHSMSIFLGANAENSPSSLPIIIALVSLIVASLLILRRKNWVSWLTNRIHLYSSNARYYVIPC